MYSKKPIISDDTGIYLNGQHQAAASELGLIEAVFWRLDSSGHNCHSQQDVFRQR